MGKWKGKKQGKAKRNRFQAREWEQMGVNEAQKYKEKADPASGSCQGEVSIPGKGWKGNILTRDRAGGASTDGGGDVCPSLNELCGVGGERVFLVEFKEPKKSLILHRQQLCFIPIPKPRFSMGHRNVLLHCQQQLCYSPKLSAYLSQLVIPRKPWNCEDEDTAI